MKRRALLGGLLLALAVAAFLFFTGRSRQPQDASDPIIEPAGYLGREACAGCHPAQDALWRGSDHDLAMQVADRETVLGNFDNATFTHFGVTSSFFEREGKYFVRTEGPDGALHDYQVAYTFGVRPLQQYLVAFPGGRYQTLSLSWDARPAADGGQRWFDLHPDEKIAPDDELHWTAPNFNWNFMCAECHSTNLRKNYLLEEDRYETTWSEIDVACEACHGPGSRHVAWAETLSQGETAENGSDKGLVVQLKDADAATWVTDMQTGLSKRSTPRQSRVEIETCARCHSRRSVVSDDYVYGRPLMDTHRPALLEEGLYHADGQIEEEVYEYGSFLQSKMYREGVTCRDCHDPHSLAARGSGNGVCAGCHLPERFDTPSHHFHVAGSPGAQCVECHMPAKNYMVVDPRRDHSLRVPRPDLTVKIGTPNACNGCHADRTASWAAEAIAERYGRARFAEEHFGEALYAGRNGLAGAEQALVRLADDPTMPGMARATAVSLLQRYLSPQSLPAVQRALESGDPLVRAAALGALEAVEPSSRLLMAYPLLSDPVRFVRLEAARALAAVPAEQMDPVQMAGRARGLEEFRIAQMANADRPGYHLNLGVVYQQLGDLEEAEDALRTALRLDPAFAPAYVNLADVYRQRNRDGEGERVLREGLTVAPNDAALHHALGLLLARQQRAEEAVEELGRAVALLPGDARYAYVYGVALHSIGETDRAVAVLDGAHQRHPADRDLLIALATISRENGSTSAAVEYARKLVALSPQDPAARQLLEQLQ